MLNELHIENFAIIDDLTLNFQEGLVIFTGETGAGKSIILDALEAVLGERVDVTSVRSGREKAFVEAVFHLEEPIKTRVNELLVAEALLEDPDELILAREIRVEGRNIARINGHNVSAGLQREVGTLLVDIHGQSEHLSLLREHHHLDLLDHFAGSSELLGEYEVVYHELKSVQKQLEQLRQSEKDSARRVDMLTYQIKEIETARLTPGEEEELRQERTRLSNAESLGSLAQQALALLDEDTPENASISILLGEVVHALADLNRIDSTTGELLEQAKTSLETLAGLVLELRNYTETIEFNPRRLDQVEERINLLNTLKRKYGNTTEEVIAFADKARLELDNITHSDERIIELGVREAQLMEMASVKASELSNKRKVAASQLAEALEAQLDELQMSKARFAVDMQMVADPEGLTLPDGDKVAFDARGIDRVAFLVAPNPGEGLKPLVKIASGGETSRLMLAIKNVLAIADTIPVLIFDEIDQGVGGRVGLVVGEKLWTLAKTHQVMCITHLPQLAAFGAQHFHVLKHIQGGRTITQVEQLESEPRQRELAQMIGPLTEGTLRSAQELLDIVAQKKGIE